MKCKCGAEIEFVQLISGKVTPVNKKLISVVCEIEDEFGNGQGKYEVITGRESHFATCKFANEFRKQKGKQ